MRDFTFFNPTRIEFGKGKEANIGQYLKEFGVDSALILYGSDRIKRNGLFDRVAASLQAQGITFAELGGVISNPLISRVRDAVKIAKDKGLQAVLAVGGGSVLDSAKAVAAGAKYDGDVWDFFVGKAVVEEAIPVFSVMTLAATGSEMNMVGVEGTTYDTHMIEHAMSALYNVPHGAGVAVVLPAWMKDIKNQKPERFERFADKVFDVAGIDAGIDKMTEWFSAIGAPVTFAQAGLSENAVDPIAENAFGNAKLWQMDSMYPRERIANILRLAV
jgi:alcohol dehydrogenase YqhD (iron-dependent ADH family)